MKGMWKSFLVLFVCALAATGFAPRETTAGTMKEKEMKQGEMMKEEKMMKDEGMKEDKMMEKEKMMKDEGMKEDKMMEKEKMMKEKETMK